MDGLVRHGKGEGFPHRAPSLGDCQARIFLGQAEAVHFDDDLKNGIITAFRMAQSVSSRAQSFLFRELLGEILFFPVWWYVDGLRLTTRTLLNNLAGVEYRLGVRLMLRNIGRPMYGDRTRSGRIISFFMRLVLIFGKGIALLVWAIIILMVWLLWLIGPLVTTGLLLRQLIPTA